MHEIGHNLGLAHSGEGTSTYDDKSGMMGYSYSSDDNPVMCFNNAKNWQLGWFQGCYTQITNPSSTAQTFWMKGSSEYDVTEKCTGSEAVTLKVKMLAL